MITVTLKRAFLAYNAIGEMMNEKMSFQDAHTILSAKRVLEPHVQFYADKEHELVEKYALKNSDGQVVFTGNQFQMPAEKVPDFTKEHGELDAVELSVDLAHNKLHCMAEIKPSVLEALMQLFEFEG